ncbi:hypothetical protein BDV12DRAFT_178106 [Aspergillus spectabilis]
MPRCFQPFLQRLHKQKASLTHVGDIELEGESNYLLSTQNLTIRDVIYFPIGAFPSPGIRQNYLPKQDRFVRMDGGHRHYLSISRSKRHFWRIKSLLDWIGLGDKGKCSNGSKSLWTAWEEWTESGSGGWPVESHKMAAITQKYGDIETVAGFGTHAFVLLLHKAQGCGPHLDRYYALKIFRRGPEQTELDYCRRVSSEYSITSSLRHPNIIEVFELLPLGYGNLCGCMEYCSGGDLHSLIVASRRLWEEEADCFFKQLMRGILYLHEMGIAHRDLKPENLLLTDRGCLKISDFGNAECFRLAWEDQVHMSTRRCGSAPYISSEQYLAQPFDPRYADIWAAAIVYIAMRVGRNPWKLATVKDECFRDYFEHRKIGRQYFLIKDISHVRLSLSLTL